MLFAMLTALLSAQNKLTLKDALQLGLSNSKSLKISKAKVDYNEAKIDEIKSQFYPQLKFSAAYSRLSDIPPFEIVTPFLPTPIKIQEPVLDTYTLKLTLQQPLFTGFKLTSVKNMNSLIKASVDAEYSKEINEEAMNIYTAFWNFYKTKQVKKLIDENLMAVEAHLSDTKNYLENELVTLNDVLKLEVQYSNIKLKQIEAVNGVEVSRAVLNRTIGLPVESKTDISIEEILPRLNEMNYDELLNEALRNRSDIEALKLKTGAGREAINAANSSWYPSVYLFSNFYYNRPNQRIMPSKDRFDESWDAGISISWDLWNWGYNSSQTEQAKQLFIQTETALNNVKEAVHVEVYSNYLNVAAAYEKIETIKKAVESAKENYRITADKYKTQLATSTELIDAETLLMQAETDLTSSTIEYELYRLKLEKSLGRKIY
jgi:outer membrane protein TolC